ncbi:hypothetical protein KBY96_15255 [Cyanobium sp. ATX 6A2]|uniref:hypothetical protein n=1 Tax=Cyanobium sp. ATX 6A2 TaxID=2823700 RepID=UPI0020CC8031|nr:hypothetical protein [Cyanobium sp. ATX 6A2]MCP9889274.1 hypothetical protein [Cyanobium sp. ATX 6A2]
MAVAAQGEHLTDRGSGNRRGEELTLHPPAQQAAAQRLAIAKLPRQEGHLHVLAQLGERHASLGVGDLERKPHGDQAEALLTRLRLGRMGHQHGIQPHLLRG